MNILNQLVNTHATIDKALILCEEFLLAYKELLLQKRFESSDENLVKDYEKDVKRFDDCIGVIKKARTFHNSEKTEYCEFQTIADELYELSKPFLQIKDYQVCGQLIEKTFYMWLKNEFPRNFYVLRTVIPHDYEEDDFAAQPTRAPILDSLIHLDYSWKDFGEYVRVIEERTAQIQSKCGHEKKTLKRRMDNVPAWLFLRYIPRNR